MPCASTANGLRSLRHFPAFRSVPLPHPNGFSKQAATFCPAQSRPHDKPFNRTPTFSPAPTECRVISQSLQAAPVHGV